MADIKVCDRCGKKLTDERSIFNVKPNRYTLSVTLFKKPKQYYWDVSPDLVTTTHDLCVECTCELSKWLEYESSMEESNG